MPTLGLSPIGDGANLEQMRDYLVRLVRDVNYLINGQLDSNNAFEFGGWRVVPDQLASKDNDVGMSTLDTGADDIRFWAGDVKTGSPKFIVTKSGILYAIDGVFEGNITADSGVIGGWLISASELSSGASYPKIVLGSTGNLLSAYNDANNYIALNPNTVSADPFIYFYSSGIVADIRINSFSGTFSLTAEQGISVSSSNDNVLLTASSGSIYASSSGGTVLDVPSEIINAQADATSALTGLSGKQDSFSGYTGTQTVVESVNFGASTTVTKTLHFSNGVLTSIT